MKKKIISVVIVLIMMVIAVVLGIVIANKTNSDHDNTGTNSKSETQSESNIKIFEEKDKEFMNPTEEYIISRISDIDVITDVAAVTEENDPNGKLNKAGGYTATVYFECSYVDLSNVEGNDVIERGTAGGGSIEVYANEEDANKRNEYLATFDGSMVSNGSHTVIGTVIIRVSDELTASQQKEVESKIIEAMRK